jgi:hypothetical protein
MPARPYHLDEIDENDDDDDEDESVHNVPLAEAIG